MRKVFKGYFLLICGELHQKRLYLVWNNFLLGDRVVRPVQRSPIAIRRVLIQRLSSQAEVTKYLRYSSACVEFTKIPYQR